MDITQALKDTENSLRDFIADVLQRKFGDDWVEICGLAEGRIEQWRERKLDEERRQRAGVVEERLIYYSDFYDIPTLLKKNWSGEFNDAFGEFKTMEVWLHELGGLRDADAHRRELLPHQKHRVLGIAGEIRTRLIRYRSKMETPDDYFPRLERVNDDLGNIWIPEKARVLRTNSVLREGDIVTFTIVGSDPQGSPLLYNVLTPLRDLMGWSEEKVISLEITNSEIMRECSVTVYIKSTTGKHHANPIPSWDDKVSFVYDVLPRKT